MDAEDVELMSVDAAAADDDGDVLSEGSLPSPRPHDVAHVDAADVLPMDYVEPDTALQPDNGSVATGPDVLQESSIMSVPPRDHNHDDVAEVAYSSYYN